MRRYATYHSAIRHRCHYSGACSHDGICPDRDIRANDAADAEQRACPNPYRATDRAPRCEMSCLVYVCIVLDDGGRVNDDKVGNTRIRIDDRQGHDQNTIPDAGAR